MEDKGEISDGYHTFNELYDHRITLFVALCRALVSRTKLTNATGSGPVFNVWRSRRHSDGEICFGTGTQFVMGVGERADEQITYHIPIERWDEASFATTLDKAPEWDGHSSADVLERLKAI